MNTQLNTLLPMPPQPSVIPPTPVSPSRNSIFSTSFSTTHGPFTSPPTSVSGSSPSSSPTGSERFLSPLSKQAHSSYGDLKNSINAMSISKVAKKEKHFASLGLGSPEHAPNGFRPPSRLPTLVTIRDSTPPPTPSPTIADFDTKIDPTEDAESRIGFVFRPKSLDSELSISPPESPVDATYFEDGGFVPAEWEFEVVKVLGEGSFSKVVGARKRRKGKFGEGEMVAIKLIKKKSWQHNERMKVSVVRELEVLKHIHHPSLISLSASFDTKHHNCLVLEYAPGGELLDFLLDFHQDMSMGLARRIFCELASVLGWMHSIYLVHRDIKLENILLTARPFPLRDPLPEQTLPPLPTRFVKLTDFGLSRFIDPEDPMLQTRCGSEEYAAPELIMSKSYDGRQTDSWALGVVLYAILTGSLPFARRKGEGKKHLVRIAKGQYEWPSDSTSEAARLCSVEAKEVVDHLLVRDPNKRATLAELKFLEWMKGWGGPKPLTFRDAWMKQGSEEVDKAVRAEVQPL